MLCFWIQTSPLFIWKLCCCNITSLNFQSTDWGLYQSKVNSTLTSTHSRSLSTTIQSICWHCSAVFKNRHHSYICRCAHQQGRYFEVGDRTRAVGCGLPDHGSPFRRGFAERQPCPAAHSPLPSSWPTARGPPQMPRPGFFCAHFKMVPTGTTPISLL